MHNPWPVDLLGLTLGDPILSAALSGHGFGQPALIARATDDPQDLWLQDSAAGLEFGFENSARLSVKEAGSPSVLRLSQVYFYGNHLNTAAYRGDLPFGLSMSDSRTDVRKKLARAGVACRPYKRDAFDLGRCILVVAYAANGNGLDFLLFLLAGRPPKYEPQRQPTLDAVLALFGKPLAGTEVARGLAPLQWPARSDAVKHGGLVNLRRICGLDVIGRAPSTMQPRPAMPTTSGNALTEVVLYRPDVLGSAGWYGAMPFDLRWNDGPEELSRKLPQPPHEDHEDDLSGWVLRHDAAFSAQIHYSAMENFIVRVRVMAPGVWDYLASA
ncbi:MAG: hypothetical protein U1E90_15740 [Burkholderiaceae bacterium]